MFVFVYKNMNVSIDFCFWALIPTKISCHKSLTCGILWSAQHSTMSPSGVQIIRCHASPSFVTDLCQTWWPTRGVSLLFRQGEKLLDYWPCFWHFDNCSALHSIILGLVCFQLTTGRLYIYLNVHVVVASWQMFDYCMCSTSWSVDLHTSLAVVMCQYVLPRWLTVPSGFLAVYVLRLAEWKWK